MAQVNGTKKDGVSRTVEEVNCKYRELGDSVHLQEENYKKYLSTLSDEYKRETEKKLDDLGFTINWETGRLKYTKKFSPLTKNLDIGYIRHGQTIGNVEPRIYQGQIDYPENQLNENGLRNAEESAKLLEEQIAGGWEPDIILISPLKRCQDTARVFCKRHPQYKTRTCDELKEIAFGEWDNVPVLDISRDNMAHLFYLRQNALVKSANPHVNKTRGENREIPPESFVDVLFRIAHFLQKLNQDPSLFPDGPKEGEKKKVVIYGHSMAGAAVSMLTGNGKFDEEGLGFDGKFILPHGTFVKLFPKNVDV